MGESILLHQYEVDGYVGTPSALPPVPIR
jgi:hypothetical protein